MDEQFLYDFRTGCGNSAKFARIFDMGFTLKIQIFGRIHFLNELDCFRIFLQELV